MKYAIVEAGVVTNVVVADAPLADNWVETDQAGPGWLYQDGQFQPPAPVVPTKAQQEALRQAAYASESDPLFFMSQRGEATVEEWTAKVAEIKARYPYPTEA
jgi:hypothetical protein